MKILLTNDDGIESNGLKRLREALEPSHEVWTFAPDGERSGRSHSITLKGAIRVRQTDERLFSCGGSPADCVLLAFHGALPVVPDLVLSGINLGPNLGTDIIYSGTAAAARQAALMGHAGVAVSLASAGKPHHLDGAVAFAAANVERFRSLWTPDHFLNINVPNVPGSGFPFRVTHPSRRIYNDRLVSFAAPDGEMYYFLEGDLAEASLEEGSDWDAVQRGQISVSPIYLHPLNPHEKEQYNAVEFRRA